MNSGVEGQVVWVEGDIAGMNFHEELDAATLLRVRQKLKPNRRRSTPRVDLKPRRRSGPADGFAGQGSAIFPAWALGCGPNCRSMSAIGPSSNCLACRP